MPWRENLDEDRGGWVAFIVITTVELIPNPLRRLILKSERIKREVERIIVNDNPEGYPDQ